MLLHSRTDQTDEVQYLYVSHFQQSSGMMTRHYDRPPLRNSVGQHQSFSGSYGEHVTVTPPQSPRMRHQSLAAIESGLCRLSLRPLAAKQEG